LKNDMVARIVVCTLTGVALPWSAMSGPSLRTPVTTVGSGREQDQVPVVLVGAGDIANCDMNANSGAMATARLLDRIPGTVFTVGDHAYPSGTGKQLRDCYEPSWGRHKARTRPAPGNHDYLTDRARPYFDYFAGAAGPERLGYYSYTLGDWHIISLNSVIDADRRSPQVEWLRKDLSENRTACTLAYWHSPVFSSGPHGSEAQITTRMLEVWRVLYEFGADVVINGHDHIYERFAPQNPKGEADPKKGIREFIVGTGGGGLYEFKKIRPNSEVRSNRSYGVLKLTLGSVDYSWEFVPGAGEQFQDTGTSACVQ
jgi:acid phosphatase type 7